MIHGYQVYKLYALFNHTLYEKNNHTYMYATQMMILIDMTSDPLRIQ